MHGTQSTPNLASGAGDGPMRNGTHMNMTTSGGTEMPPNQRLLTVGSFNCHGFSNSLDYALELATSCDVLALSETWIREGDERLINLALNQCGALEHESFTVVSKSGMSDVDPEYTGRPYGGVSLICKHSDSFNFHALEVPSERIAAISLHDASGQLCAVIVAVYMPYFHSANHPNTQEYTSTLSALQSVLDEYGARAPTCIVGDFNAQLPMKPRLHRLWQRASGFNQKELIRRKCVMIPMAPDNISAKGSTCAMIPGALKHNWA